MITYEYAVVGCAAKLERLWKPHFNTAVIAVVEGRLAVLVVRSKWKESIQFCNNQKNRKMSPSHLGLVTNSLTDLRSAACK